MASIRKYGQVWQAQVRRKGVPSVTKSFRRKSAATAWAKTIESEIERGWLTDVSAAQNTTVAALLARYETEILPTKRAQASERSRIKRLSRALGAFNLVQLSPTALARYRNERLKSASTQTVRHELSLLRRIINVARSEWGIFLPRGNPVATTALPKPSLGRTRRLEGDEEARLLCAVVTSGALLMAGVGVYVWWQYALATVPLFPGLPAEYVESIGRMRDSEALREAALTLVRHRNDIAQDVTEMLSSLIDLLVFTSLAGALFIWLNTLLAVKAHRKASGEELGWLRWL